MLRASKAGDQGRFGILAAKTELPVQHRPQNLTPLASREPFLEYPYSKSLSGKICP